VYLESPRRTRGFTEKLSLILSPLTMNLVRRIGTTILNGVAVASPRQATKAVMTPTAMIYLVTDCPVEGSMVIGFGWRVRGHGDQ